MSERRKEEATEAGAANVDLRSVIRETVEEYVRKEASKSEPAYKNELTEERKRREQLERRVNELIKENARSQRVAEEAERNTTIRAELQRLGVAKVDLAFRAVREDIRRAEDGRLVVQGDHGVIGVKEHLAQFVKENPEFLPARNIGGSGMTTSQRQSPPSNPPIDLDKIKPGMSAEELEQVREQVARIASESLGTR
jgi:hypothetical protein